MAQPTRPGLPGRPAVRRAYSVVRRGLQQKTPLPSMRQRKDFLKSVAVTVGSQAVVFLKGLLLVPILVKSAGVALYGGYVLVMTSVSFVQGISSLGVGYRFKRTSPGLAGPAERREVFLPQFNFHILATLGMGVVLGLTLGLWGGDALGGRSLLWVVPTLMVANTLQSQIADYFRFTDRVGWYNVITTARTVLFLAAVLVLFAQGRDLGVVRLLTLEAGATALTLALPTALVLREVGWGRVSYDAGALAADIRVGFPLTLSHVSDFALSSGDRYLIALVLGVGAVGLYSPAYALGAIIILIAKVMGVVLPPRLARARDLGDQAAFAGLVDLAVAAYLAVAIPFTVGAYVLGRPLLRLMANDAVADGGGLIAGIVAAAMIFYGLASVLEQILFVEGRTGAIMRSTVGAGVVNLVLNAALLSVWPHLAVAAWTTLVSYAVALVYLAVASADVHRVRVPWSTITWCVAGSALMASVLLTTVPLLEARLPLLPAVLAAVALGVAVYGSFMTLPLRALGRRLDDAGLAPGGAR